MFHTLLAGTDIAAGLWTEPRRPRGPRSPVSLIPRTGPAPGRPGGPDGQDVAWGVGAIREPLEPEPGSPADHPRPDE
ncbi:hypothetical protein GCM10010344_12000 [Streptomyces bluensis]|nr:hypothetical protein GCM10010344_12000 [Streptomyces bluensis]